MSSTIKLCILNFLLLFNLKTCKTTNYTLEFSWSFVNFTWPTPAAYQTALAAKTYIPGHVAIAGIKSYANYLYFALPRIRSGVPTTFARLHSPTAPKFNPPLEPYPFLHTNQTDCRQLQSVQSMEIDPDGVLWLLDGVRIGEATPINFKCPAKLVLFNLNKTEQVHCYQFQNGIVSNDGGFLNDIVLDLGHAYITDHGQFDPGLIVYSIRENTAWKLRDSSFYPQMSVKLDVGGVATLMALPLDGIALSPIGNRTRFVYYCSLTGRQLFKIETKYLIERKPNWQSGVILVGEKATPGDGMAMDNDGNLYFGLLTQNGVAKWKDGGGKGVEQADVIGQNDTLMVWPDSFAFDNNGGLFLLSNSINRFFDTNYKLKVEEKAIINVIRFETGTKSYLFE